MEKRSIKQRVLLQQKKIVTAQGQTAIEYMLLFSMVAVVVLLAFTNLMPRTGDMANAYFQKVSAGIMGDPVPVACQADNPCSSYDQCGVRMDNCGNNHSCGDTCPEDEQCIDHICVPC